MKKQLLPGILALIAMAHASAQNNYSQNFEATDNAILAEGWHFPAFNGVPENVGIYYNTPSIANIGIQGKSIGIATFNIVNQIPVPIPNVDAAIVSPPIQLGNVTAELRYLTGGVRISGNANTTYSVYIITEAEYDAAITPSDLKILIDGKVSEDTATLINASALTSFDLPDFQDEVIRIVFRLHNSPGNSILLFDDIVVTGGTLGTGNFTAFNFTMHPNPVQDKLTVSAGNAEIQSVTITDLNGRRILSQNKSGLQITEIDMESLPAGVYLVTATTDTGTTTKKVVKS